MRILIYAMLCWQSRSRPSLAAVDPGSKTLVAGSGGYFERIAHHVRGRRPPKMDPNSQHWLRGPDVK